MTPRLPYEPAMDGLRAPAVVSVIVFHAVPASFPGGFLGVDVFFVLSGYLITSLLLVEYESARHINLTRFFIGRLLRLAPAMAIMLIVYGLVIWQFESNAAWRDQGVDMLLTATYMSNWARALAIKDLADLGHTWSLSVEAQFYLIWPVLLGLMLRRKANKQQLLLLVLLLGAMSFASRQWLLSHGNGVPRLYNGLDTRVETLLWGVALALALRGARPKSVFNAGLAWGSMSALVALAMTSDWASEAYYQTGISMVAALSACLIGCLATDHAGGVKRVLAYPWLVWIGMVSYGMYLWHFPILRLLLSMNIEGGTLLLMCLLLTIPIAGVSYHCLELPLMIWGKEKMR